jgi:hypothetical protein
VVCSGRSEREERVLMTVDPRWLAVEADSSMRGTIDARA